MTKPTRKERKSGYYWVITSKKEAWKVAEWDNEYVSWYLTGISIYLDDSDFSYISPTPISIPILTTPCQGRPKRKK